MAAPAFTLAGVDGFSKQWLAVVATSDFAECAVRPFCHLADLLEAYPWLQVAAIDTPIGLPDEQVKHRKCDEEAKVLLGARRSSIFYAPPRYLLDIPSHAKASALSRQKVGEGISMQAFNIIPYIRDADAVTQARGQGVIKEVHPEVSFCQMNGSSPLQYSKHKQKGRHERRGLLETHVGQTAIESCDKARYGTGAALDDLYDALAALWTAQRILSGQSKKLPAHPQVDSQGLFMEINY